jgi:hypothetical protein
MLLDFLKAAPGFFIPGSLHIQNPDQAKKIPDYLQLCYIHYPEIHKEMNKRKALHT